MTALLLICFLLVMGTALTAPKLDWSGSTPTQESVGCFFIIIATLGLLFYVGAHAQLAPA